MKKFISACLALLMAITLVACGNKSGAKEEVGVYTFYSLTIEGETLTKDDLAELGDGLDDMFKLEFKADGKAVLNMYGEEVIGDYSNGKLTTPDGEMNYELKDGKLTLTMGGENDSLVFEKQ